MAKKMMELLRQPAFTGKDWHIIGFGSVILLLAFCALCFALVKAPATVVGSGSVTGVIWKLAKRSIPKVLRDSG